MCGMLLRHHSDNSVRQQVGLAKTYYFPTLPFLSSMCSLLLRHHPDNSVRQQVGLAKAYVFSTVYMIYYSKMPLMCVASSRQQVGLAKAHVIPTYKFIRVGQDHIYTVYSIRYIWQKNHRICGHIRCIHNSGRTYILLNKAPLMYVTSSPRLVHEYR